MVEHETFTVARLIPYVSQNAKLTKFAQHAVRNDQTPLTQSLLNQNLELDIWVDLTSHKSSDCAFPL